MSAEAWAPSVERPASRKLAGRALGRAANVHVRRGVAGVACFVVIWQLGTALHVPVLSKVPTPVDVAQAAWAQLHQPRYYFDWLTSMRRVLLGFFIAVLIGIPLGLFMGWKTAVRQFAFPVLEVLRPIPPLAWVPLSILFWPTPESSIIFVLFLGAFFTVLINTVAGVRTIDERHIRAAVSLGATPATVFRRIILPGALPSIGTGMAIGIGITWEVLVAAEIIAGRNGLGYMTWEAYVAGNMPTIIVGMISIGIAGYLSSIAVRALVARAMPWRRRA
jgi:NitT/TauT family transport system permease protein